MKWFTSDTHYYHSAIIKYCKRPFDNVEKMNEYLIKKHNERVAPGDCVYHLGDFGFTDASHADYILRRLNGQKFLIFGNHDQILRNQKPLQNHFIWCKDYHEESIGKDKSHRVVLCHYPIMSWHGIHRGTIMAHGHCHHNLQYPFNGRIIDVGVDGKGYDYGPISEFDIIKYVGHKKIVTGGDHHKTSD